MACFTEPVAQQFTTITDISKRPVHQGEVLVGDAPSLLRAPDGSLLCAVPLVCRPSFEGTLLFYRSDDGGTTWRQLPQERKFLAGRLFEHDGSVYFIGNGPYREDGIRVIRSDDWGDTWTEPSTVIRGTFYNAASGIVERNGQLYWCSGTTNESGEFNRRGSRTVSFAGDLSTDLTSPGAWRSSNYLTYPGTPDLLRSGLFEEPDSPYPDHWLEGNVVEVNGNLRVFWRTRMDGYATPGMCAVCDLYDDGTNLAYSFAQFYPWPGAQNHFHIIHDHVSGFYWMTANLTTHSQDLEFAEKLARYGRFSGRPGNQRRILALQCSFNALNWLTAGYLVIWPQPRRSCNYTTPLIDGDDLLVVSRTSYDGPDQHDNDLATFHRVSNFRVLAERFMPQWD